MKYKRILLKLSGESLMGDQHSGISQEILTYFASEVIDITGAGAQVAIVIGGGNIFRGVAGSKSGFDRVRGDQMGMLATVINSLALENELVKLGAKAKVFTSVRMEPIGELYRRDRVVEFLENGTVCILAGGTGNPFFTTDTASALRAVETGAELLLKGTRVDGVYSDDPEKVADATLFNSVSFDEVISRQLRIMDITAFTMCRENNMPVVVFNMNIKGNLLKVVNGEQVGTLIHSED